MLDGCLLYQIKIEFDRASHEIIIYYGFMIVVHNLYVQGMCQTLM